jgi:hypothetical protein
MYALVLPVDLQIDCKRTIKRQEPGADWILKSVLRRPPLVGLTGDVGSGKSERAETTTRPTRT